MLLGTGGTGKSTINNIVRMFYDSEDVAVIGNNFQTLFGLADIYEKICIYCSRN
jgi:phage/plasmid-associated DNA primase